MTQFDPAQFSRIAATAESLGDAAPDRHRFIDKAVLLTGEEEILSTPNGRQCFLDCLRLLMRMVHNLTVDLPQSSQLYEEVGAIVAALSFGPPPRIQGMHGVSFEDFDAILSVGYSGQADQPWTVINSNGWVARVSSKGRSLPSDCSRANPVGALGAACLGAAEVFKRLIRLRPERGGLHDVLVFSFCSYLVEDDPGPPLPQEIPLNLLLVGAGAIGNGTIHLLGSLPVTGLIMLVDGQTFCEENWATSILVGPKDFGVAKAVAGEEWIRGKITAKGYSETVESFRNRCGKEIGYPKLVINGLDSILARRAVQDLWPDQIIDGAIGPTSCEVTLHPWGPDLSCLKCDFEEAPRPVGLTQQQATGLRRERLANQNLQIDEEDIRNAPPEKQDWLRQRQGQQICSVVSEGVLAMLAAESLGMGFRPSVPFVACLSSCMIVSELIRYVQGLPPILETGFQFDVMIGPERGQRKSHSRKADCICVTRRETIELFRERRTNQDGP